MPAGMIDERTE